VNLDQIIIKAIQASIGHGPHHLHQPSFNGNEQDYVRDCILSTYVSSVGGYVDKFERALESYTGAKRAIATVNGTAALHLALQLAGVRPGDEVLLPALTFVATSNAVHYLGATPHFVDSEAKTLGMDPRALREWLEYMAEPTAQGYRNSKTGRRLSAVVPMHTFGHPCELEELLAVSYDYQLTLVEDAAESLGSFYYGRHTGTFGLCGTLSFNGNKIITTGGGGAILTNDERLADHAKHLSTTAKIPHAWNYVHDEIGFNYRMPNLNAALGCAQLEELPEFLLSKRRLTNRYSHAFSGMKGFSLVKEPPGCSSNYWLQTLLLDESAVDEREGILLATNQVSLMTRPAWTLMHLLKANQNCPHAPLPIAESLAQRLINLPSSSGIA
jgi:aminotransferase in exopolysaccharide biosynthesis